MRERRDILAAIRLNQQQIEMEEEKNGKKNGSIAKKTLNKNDFGVTQMNYSSRHFNLAKVFCEQLVEALHLSDVLQMRITGILGSDLIKGALD